MLAFQCVQFECAFARRELLALSTFFQPDWGKSMERGTAILVMKESERKKEIERERKKERERERENKRKGGERKKEKAGETGREGES